MTAFQKQEYGRKIMSRFTKKYIVALLLGVLLVAIPGSRMAVGLEIVEEEIGPGSVYGLFVQDGWNGDLALYAHGHVDASSPIGLPTATQIEPLRDAMPGMGYAVAYSSFSENGWADDDGVRRTRQLRGIFNSEFGSPNRTYLVAHSMGALVAAKLAEKTNHYGGKLEPARTANRQPVWTRRIHCRRDARRVSRSRRMGRIRG